MKRSLCNLLVVLLCINLMSSTAFAFETNEERIDYSDGSFAIITTETSYIRSTINRSKIYNYYNSSQEKCFSYILSASFTYNGTTSCADSCYADMDIYRKGWDVDSHDEYTSGNTAYGEAVFSGPGGASRAVSLTLTCDKNGNVT